MTKRYIDEDVNFDNENTLAMEEEQVEEEIVEQEGTPEDFTTTPLLEYGIEQLVKIERVQHCIKKITIKGKTEHDTTKIQESRFCRFFVRVIEYPQISEMTYKVCTNREQGNALLKATKENSFGVCVCTFTPKEIEVPERDKKTGKPTGNYVTIIVPNIVNYRNATKEEENEAQAVLEKEEN